MITRLLGMAFIMLSSTVLGYYYSGKDGYRINDLRQMKKAFLILRSEVEYTLSPIKEAIESIAEKTEKPVSNIFKDFKNYLEENPRDGCENLWKNAIVNNKKSYFFVDEDISMFLSFGKVVGGMDKNLQLGTIDMILAFIDEKIEEATIASVKNKKLYRSLGILSGLALCIVFF
ncbi:MAG: stage III sporulation protein AB [Defluviitaleaceae bacterium]|nr:stage III sporulation protein AB [Defluviitaleaceae bacterium]